MLPILGLLAKIVLGEEGRAGPGPAASSADPREILDLVSHLGGVMVLLIAMALVLGAVLSGGDHPLGARAEEKRFAYLRLGKEELQLLVVSLITWAAALGVTVIPSGAWCWARRCCRAPRPAGSPSIGGLRSSACRYLGGRAPVAAGPARLLAPSHRHPRGLDADPRPVLAAAGACS
jgi:hypothetical protein